MAGDIKAMKSKVDAADYAQFLPAMKARVSHARSCAARAVNHELVLRYWDSGRGIVETGQAAGWGDAVVAQLSADLLAAFSDMRGFSAANLWRMKQIYLARTSAEFLDKGTLRADKPDMSAVEPDINRTLITITPPLPIAANGAKPLIRLCCGGSCEVA